MKRALDAIQHRGPDARGTHFDPQGRYALGHLRLSVIDVAASSNQPMWSECGRYVAIFNGEIYNYLEIRAELEKEGVRFRTNSDTEVLMMAIVRWGHDAINRFNGMWSFVFGDTRTNRFLISRDRWGVKPLFACERAGSLILCSEAKGILAWLGSTPRPNPHAIGLYLKYGMGGECQESWFEGVERFPQASYREFDLAAAGDSPCVAYWDYPLRRSLRDAGEVRERFEALLVDATRIRLRSDVPVGLSLSGGIDSASIAWIVGGKFQRGLEAYTAWHEPKEKSELPRAIRVAKQFGHTMTDVPETSHDQLVQDLKTCIYHLDAGHNSPAIVPYLNLCRAARSTLTVMLEGQGADELLGGYASFDLFAGLDYLLRGKVGQAASCVRANARSMGWGNVLMDALRFSSVSVYAEQARRWNAQNILCQESMDAVPESFRHLSLSRTNLSDALIFWHRYNLTNLLQYGDAVSMSVNLETRCPFLDYRLVELGFAVDTQLLLRDGFGKHVLRTLTEPVLPRDIVWREKKDGFGNSTTRMVREVVERRGIPRAAAEAAMDMGLLLPKIQDPGVFMNLPENIQFRLFSVFLWFENFYARDRAAPRPA